VCQSSKKYLLINFHTNSNKQKKIIKISNRSQFKKKENLIFLSSKFSEILSIFSFLRLFPKKKPKKLTGGKNKENIKKL